MYVLPKILKARRFAVSMQIYGLFKFVLLDVQKNTLFLYCKYRQIHLKEVLLMNTNYTYEPG